MRVVPDRQQELVAAFSVVGSPQTAGSKSALPKRRKDGSLYVNVVDGGTPELRQRKASWRSDVVNAAKDFMDETSHESMRDGRWEKLDGAVEIELVFRLDRPAAAKKRRWPFVKPDLGKLVRSTEDALKVAGIYSDDARICREVTEKRYAEPGERTGVDIRIWRME